MSGAAYLQRISQATRHISRPALPKINQIAACTLSIFVKVCHSRPIAHVYIASDVFPFDLERRKT